MNEWKSVFNMIVVVIESRYNATVICLISSVRCIKKTEKCAVYLMATHKQIELTHTLILLVLETFQRWKVLLYVAHNTHRHTVQESVHVYVLVPNNNNNNTHHQHKLLFLKRKRFFVSSKYFAYKRSIFLVEFKRSAIDMEMERHFPCTLT